MLKNYIGILSAIENKQNLRRLAEKRAIASIPLGVKAQRTERSWHKVRDRKSTRLNSSH